MECSYDGNKVLFLIILKVIFKGWTQGSKGSKRYFFYFATFWHCFLKPFDNSFQRLGDDFDQLLRYGFD